MSMFAWFDSGPSVAFARELAQSILGELSEGIHARDHRYKVKAEKVLRKTDRRVQEFRSRERLNVYKRSKLANAFLWELKDRGCPADYATELTEWLTFRL